MKRRVLFLGFTALVSGFAVAENQTVDTVLVTATRTEREVRDSLASITVVSKDDILRLQATDVYQILATVPGVSFINTGVAGGNVSIFLRGTSPSKTLFLLDGQRISSATLGQPNLAYLHPEQIERIEIVRGSRASLYGADAIGGVIHIFTRRSSDVRQLTVSAGIVSDAFSGDESYTLQNHHVGLNTPLGETTSLNLDLNYEGSGGIDDTQDKTFGGADDDAYRNSGINLGARKRIGTAELLFQYLFNDIHKEHDLAGGCSDVSYNRVTCQPFSDSKVENVSLEARVKPLKFWDLTLSAGRFSEKTESGDDLAGDPTQVYSIADIFETERSSLSLQSDFSIAAEQLLTLGLDYYEDVVGGYIYSNGGVFGVPSSRMKYLDEKGKPVDSRDNKALFVEYQAEFGDVSIIAGARRDDNEKYGGNTTENIALGYQFRQGMRLILSWASAFKAPTFNDLYWPDGANPFLQPEESNTTELRLAGEKQSLLWEVSIYRTEIEDMIEWAPAPTLDNPYKWEPSNVEEAQITGVEFSASAHLKEWLLSVSVSALDAEYRKTVDADGDGQGDNDGNDLVVRPNETLKIDLDRSFERLDFGVSIIAESERYQDKANMQRTGGYGLVSLRFAYKLSETLMLQFKTDNLFDKEYVTRQYPVYDDNFNEVYQDYTTLGRTAFLSINWTPTF